MTAELPIPCNSAYCLLHLREPFGSLGRGLAYSRHGHDTWHIWDVSSEDRPRQLVMRYLLAHSAVVDVNLFWSQASIAIAQLGFGTTPQQLAVPAQRGMETHLSGGDWVRVPVAIRNLELTTRYEWTAFLDVNGDLVRGSTVPVSFRLMSDAEGVERGRGTLSVSENGVEVAVELVDTTRATPLAGELMLFRERVPFAESRGVIRLRLDVSEGGVATVVSASLKQLLTCDDPTLVEGAVLTRLLRSHWDLAAPIVKDALIPMSLRRPDLEAKAEAYLARVAASRRN